MAAKLDELLGTVSSLVMNIRQIESELYELKMQRHYEKELLTKREVADFFSVDELTIDRWYKKNPNFPPPISINPGVRQGSLRWRKSDLIDYLNELSELAQFKKKLKFNKVGDL